MKKLDKQKESCEVGREGHQLAKKFLGAQHKITKHFKQFDQRHKIRKTVRLYKSKLNF
jgi:hypothetical protein